MNKSTNEQILYLQSSILTELHTRCGLSQNEVTNLLKTTNLLEFIEDNYDLYHIESIYNILEDIQQYVKGFGFTFKIKYDT